MGKYEDFDAVTRKSLRHAAAEAGSPLKPAAVDAVMGAYYQLPAFPDAAPAWKELAADGRVELAIFSNGAHARACVVGAS
jgi:2-haloacid dehalogenase